MKIGSKAIFQGGVKLEKLANLGSFQHMLVVDADGNVFIALPPQGGGTQDQYFYFASQPNQPQINTPGLQLTNATTRFIALEKHGLANDKGSYKITVDLLLHGDHKFTSTNIRYGFSITRRYEFSVYVEDVPGTGDLPYFDNIKTTYFGGKWIRYSATTNMVIAQGDLREMDIAASLSVSNTYLRLNIINNLLSNPALPGFDFPLYGKYRVKVENFSTTMTTTQGGGEQQPAG